MLLTIFLAIVFCAAITLMLLSAVAFIQNEAFFSSAPREAREAILPREKELFVGARTIGWTLMIFSVLLIKVEQHHIKADHVFILVIAGA